MRQAHPPCRESGSAVSMIICFNSITLSDSHFGVPARSQTKLVTCGVAIDVPGHASYPLPFIVDIIETHGAVISTNDP